MTDSPPQSIALAIAPKITAFLSICGSSTIISKVIRDPKARSDTMPRIMLGLSMCDALVAASFFASTWPIPEGTPTRFGDGSQPIFGARGTDDSCNVAGFFTQYQVASPLFNSTLATYYLLVVYHGWTDRRIKKVEWLFYAIPISFAIITATFAVATNLIGPVEWTCAIMPSEFFIDGAEMTPIQSNFQLIRWIILFGPVWVCIVYISIIFAMLYRKMRALEVKMESYKPRINRRYMKTENAREDGNKEMGEAVYNKDVDADIEESIEQDGRERLTLFRKRGKRRGESQPNKEQYSSAKRSKKIAIQGMLYVMAFYVTWLFPTISRITDFTGKKYFVVQFIDTFLLPLQALNKKISRAPSKL